MWVCPFQDQMPREFGDAQRAGTMTLGMMGLGQELEVKTGLAQNFVT